MVTVTDIISPLASHAATYIEVETIKMVCEVFVNAKNNGELLEPKNFNERFTLDTLELHCRVLKAIGVLS